MMKKILLTGLVFAALTLSHSVLAQGVKDIRINEILVLNENNYEDDYGHREGWIELFNSGYSQVDVGGCHLSTQSGGRGEIYRIPKGDPRTRIAPQSYLIFIAEGTSSKGTFHTNFTLDETGYLALFDQSGRGEPLSEITYNVADQKPDISIGWLNGANGKLQFVSLPATTPNATNETVAAIPAHERFRQLDPYGVVMSVTAMTVVFFALAMLYLIFRIIGKTMVKLSRPKDKVKSGEKPALVPHEGISGEEIAAVAMALRLYEEDLHDNESKVVTINKVARTYSPWSSKIYGIRQLPDRRK